MTMKLANTPIRMLVTLAAASCLFPALFAQTKPAPKAARKTKTKVAAVASKKAEPKSAPAVAAASAPAPEEKAVPAVAKRDPFLPLIAEKKDIGNTQHLPPGKGGLVIGSVHVDGTVHSSDGMIAVLSNPEEHVYFVHEGDRLYDGDVEKITLDGVTFRQNSKDVFGKAIERVVTKRIYASAGEQQ
jgi:hypothetical protein